MLREFIFLDVIARAKECFGCTSDRALAERLGMSPQTLGNRKNTGSIPYAELLSVAMETGSDVQYILTGRRANAYPAGQAEGLEVNDVASDPLTRKKEKIKQLLDQTQDAALVDRVQDDLEKNERMKRMERELAELRKKA